MLEFNEYIVHGELGQNEKAEAWQTVIDLLNDDWWKVSAYLLDVARQHIEGYIPIDEARERIKRSLLQNYFVKSSCKKVSSLSIISEKHG